MGDLHRMNETELDGAIDALLAKAARVSPPRNMVESEQQAGALRQLARARDELHRRARARALPGGNVSTAAGAGAGARRAASARAAIARAPSEDQVDTAIARLEALTARARDNLVAAGRDPRGARVTLDTLRDELGLARTRWRALLGTLENRGLVQIDAGGFVATTWRAAA